MRIAWLLVGFALAVGKVRAAPSAEDFARPPEYGQAQLSPDGKSAAVLHHENRGGSLLIWDLAKKKNTRFESWAVYDGDGTRSTAGIRDFRWLTDNRLFFRTEGAFFNDYTYADAYRANVEAAIQRADLPANVSRETYRTQVLMDNAGYLMMADSELTDHVAVSGFFAADRDGQNRIEMPGVSKDATQGGEAYFVWNPDTLQVSRLQPGSVFMAYEREGWSNHPHLGRFYTSSGGVQVVVENPGNVDGWLLDWDEHPRLGVTRLPTTRLWHKPADAKQWSVMADLGLPPGQIALHHFDPTGKMLYVSRVEPGGNWALYTYNLETRQWSGEPQLRDARFDITPGEGRLAFADAELTAPVFSPRRRDLIGVRYVNDGPRQLWFDPHMGAAQRVLDAKFPGKVNMILGMNEAENRFAVLSWSARDPGSYGVFDEATAGFVRLAQRMPWIKAEEMGETFPFACRGDDGLELEGYLTKPPGTSVALRPMVVLLLREHPWQRDVWGFDPWVQFLATRGYAVLQVNYRGTFGYGPAFHQKGLAETSRSIETDIESAVKWAVQNRIADPHRVAIVGRGFGGTCALLALSRPATPYRCGVAITAVTDWPDLLAHSREPARRYWVEAVGFLHDGMDRELLRQISPITFAGGIGAPVLLVHATNAATAPMRGAKAMAAALERAGHKPDTHFYVPRDDRLGVEKTDAATLRKIEAFLAEHLVASPVAP